MTLAELVDQAIEQAGNQAKLAELIGVTQSNVSGFRKGTRPCGMDKRMQLAKVAGVDPRRVLVDYLADQLDETDEYKAEVKERVIAIYESLDPETKKPLQALGSQGVSWRKRRITPLFQAAMTRILGTVYGTLNNGFRHLEKLAKSQHGVVTSSVQPDNLSLSL